MSRFSRPRPWASYPRWRRPSRRSSQARDADRKADEQLRRHCARLERERAAKATPEAFLSRWWFFSTPKPGDGPTARARIVAILREILTLTGGKLELGGLSDLEASGALLKALEARVLLVWLVSRGERLWLAPWEAINHLVDQEEPRHV